MIGIESLVGEIIKSVSTLEQHAGEVVFTCESGKVVRMYHEQDCCESVSLADFCGDASDIIGSTVVSAEERSSRQSTDYGSETWTFYEIQTSKGSLWLRWCGWSNGYYSESVDIDVTSQQ